MVGFAALKQIKIRVGYIPVLVLQSLNKTDVYLTWGVRARDCFQAVLSEEGCSWCLCQRFGVLRFFCARERLLWDLKTVYSMGTSLLSSTHISDNSDYECLSLQAGASKNFTFVVYLFICWNIGNAKQSPYLLLNYSPSPWFGFCDRVFLGSSRLAWARWTPQPIEGMLSIKFLVLFFCKETHFSSYNQC